MNYIRTIGKKLIENLGKKPIIVLYGARQVGKTTLAKSIMGEFKSPLYLQGDDPKDAQNIEGRSGKELSSIISGHDIVVIDEAQRIKDIGSVLKLIADNNPKVKLIATGSSSFELVNKLSEPLTGRNRKFFLYPLSVKEVVSATSVLEVKKELESYLIFGMYPQVVSAKSRAEKALLVKELISDYLYKDLFIFGGIRNSFAFEKLVKLLALRVGSEISYPELAKEVGISKSTVLSYINLLEQSFIVFRLNPLYGNKTKEINKRHKIYFYDTGVRNAVLGATDPVELRTDKGALLENFFISEKIKSRVYENHESQINFWRNRQSGEVDFVESFNNGKKILAFECKWKGDVFAPSAFVAMYSGAKFECVNYENIVEKLFNN
ncbi:MAG: ATP-binding protein [bacterium]|nr:ATP-binding protein [bacterium]